MSEKQSIKDAIKKMAQRDHDGFSVVCTVDSVDLSGMTCYCVSVKDGADIQGVRLNAQNNPGFLLIPQVGSKVIVSFLSDNSAFVSMVSTVSEIRLNGTTHGGIAKTRDVALKFNALEVDENAFKVIVAAILQAGLSSPGTPVTNASLAAYFNTYNVTPITPTTQAELSNTTVKHGS